MASILLSLPAAQTRTARFFEEGSRMGANSTQGLATLVFLAAFTCLSGALFADDSLVLYLLFLVLTAVSVGLFLKARPWEHMEQ